MSEFDLQHLPDIVLEKVLLHFSYDEIARFRIICKRFDSLCKKLLNKGYIAAEKSNSQSIKAMKLQLPRRESERQLHPMARNLDILCAIETRTTMLSMTFMKFVDIGLCCFIPGKVIDEIFRVLKYVKNCRNPSQPHEVLKELRDISSMAMDYFNEKIAPGLKSSLVSGAFIPSPFASLCSVSASPNANPNSSQSYLTDDKLRLEFQKSKRRDQKIKRELQSLKNKVRQHKSRLIVQNQKLALQAELIAEQDAQIAEMNCALKEWDQKFGDLIAGLSCVSDQNAILTAASKLSQEVYLVESEEDPLVQPVLTAASELSQEVYLIESEEDPLVQPVLTVSSEFPQEVFLIESQEDSGLQPSTSFNWEGGKRKLENQQTETPEDPKKKKIEENICVITVINLSESVSSLQSGLNDT